MKKIFLVCIGAACVILFILLNCSVSKNEILTSLNDSVLLNRDSINQLNYNLSQIKEYIEEEISDNNVEQLLFDELSNKKLDVLINDESLVIDLRKNDIVLNPNKLTTEFANKIEVKCDDNVEVYFDDVNVKDTKNIYVDKIEKNLYINIKIKYKNAERNYKLELLPNDFPSVSVSVNKGIDGEIYSNFINDRNYSYVYKMSNNGDILFYKRGHYNLNGSLMNFNKHISNEGKIRYSYFEPTLNSHGVYKSGLNYGNIILMDEQYNVLKEIGLKKTKLNSDNLAENHEFIYFDDNHYIISGATDKTIIVNNETNLIKASYFQEVKNNEVIFEWSSIDEPSLLEESVENNHYINKGNKLVSDYVHMNSIDIDPIDGNFICSFRNQNTIAKIDRETGRVLWKLGGIGDNYNLSDEQIFSRQHYAKIQSDGSILIFDNGNDREQTRIIKFLLDEEKKEIIDFKSYQVDGKYSLACGSVQAYDLENDIYTIGWGASQNDYSIMSVIDFKNGEVLLELYTDNPIATYRSLIY